MVFFFVFSLLLVSYSVFFSSLCVFSVFSSCLFPIRFSSRLYVFFFRFFFRFSYRPCKVIRFFLVILGYPFFSLFPVIRHLFVLLVIQFCPYFSFYLLPPVCYPRKEYHRRPYSSAGEMRLARWDIDRWKYDSEMTANVSHLSKSSIWLFSGYSFFFSRHSWLSIFFTFSDYSTFVCFTCYSVFFSIFHFICFRRYVAHARNTTSI